jgi:hypothetical protein
MHGFGYVGRMIAHPLDILAAKDEMHAAWHLRLLGRKRPDRANDTALSYP